MRRRFCGENEYPFKAVSLYPHVYNDYNPPYSYLIENLESPNVTMLNYNLGEAVEVLVNLDYLPYGLNDASGCPIIKSSLINKFTKEYLPDYEYDHLFMFPYDSSRAGSVRVYFINLKKLIKELQGSDIANMERIGAIYSVSMHPFINPILLEVPEWESYIIFDTLNEDDGGPIAWNCHELFTEADMYRTYMYIHTMTTTGIEMVGVNGSVKLIMSPYWLCGTGGSFILTLPICAIYNNGYVITSQELLMADRTTNLHIRLINLSGMAVEGFIDSSNLLETNYGYRAVQINLLVSWGDYIIGFLKICKSSTSTTDYRAVVSIKVSDLLLSSSSNKVPFNIIVPNSDLTSSHYRIVLKDNTPYFFQHSLSILKCYKLSATGNTLLSTVSITNDGSFIGDIKLKVISDYFVYLSSNYIDKVLTSKDGITWNDISPSSYGYGNIIVEIPEEKS